MNVYEKLISSSDNSRVVIKGGCYFCNRTYTASNSDYVKNIYILSKDYDLQRTTIDFFSLSRLCIRCYRKKGKNSIRINASSNELKEIIKISMKLDIKNIYSDCIYKIKNFDVSIDLETFLLSEMKRVINEAVIKEIIE